MVQSSNMHLSVYVYGYCDYTSGFSGWAAIIKNNSLNYMYELYNYDTNATERRMVQYAINEAFNSIFNKYGYKNMVDLIVPALYYKQSIGDWINGSPSRNEGWMYKWAKRDWKNSKDVKVNNSILWESIYNNVCKQHTVRVSNSEHIRSSAYLDRCQYLAQCAVKHVSPTPSNIDIHPNVFENIAKNPGDDVYNIVNTSIGYRAVVKGLRKLTATLPIDCFSKIDLVDLEQTIEMLKMRLREKN